MERDEVASILKRQADILGEEWPIVGSILLCLCTALMQGREDRLLHFCARFARAETRRLAGEEQEDALEELECSDWRWN